MPTGSDWIEEKLKEIIESPECDYSTRLKCFDMLLKISGGGGEKAGVKVSVNRKAVKVERD